MAQPDHAQSVVQLDECSSGMPLFGRQLKGHPAFLSIFGVIFL